MNTLRFLASAPLTAKFGMIVIALYVFAACFANFLAPYSETEIVGRALQPSSPEFLLGTDQVGRDMLSRIIFGARNTVGISFATTLLAFVIGCGAAMFAAVSGGWVDQIVSRAVDALMAIPQLIFALLLLTIFGTGIVTLIVVIAVLDATRIFRLARSVAINVVVMDFIEAARLRGEGNWYLIRHEILPNMTAPLIAEFGLRFCFVFLLIAALSFLGLGIQPPIADWGGMVAANKTLISFANYDLLLALIPLIPAVAIALLTVSVNFVVDWMLKLSSGLKD